MIVDKNSGQHLNIAMGRSLFIFTALLELFLVFFLFHTFLPFLFLLRTFWSLGCSLTALGLFGTPTGKAAVKVTLRYSGWNLLCLPLFLLFVLFGSARSLLLAFHQPQESQEQENLGDMCKDLSFLLENLKRRRKTKF